MNMPTATASAGDADFNRIAFALITDGIEPTAEDPGTAPARRSRPSRRIVQDEAIRESLGIVRNRTHEREV